MSKLKLWDSSSSWEQAEQTWEQTAKEAAQKKPIKGLKNLPSMPGITSDTAKFLKWKSFKYMLQHDQQHKILKNFLKHPFRYGWNYLKSLVHKQTFKKDGDFFLYGVKSVEEFQTHLARKNTLLIVGFSYCQKPHECPSGRFTDKCSHDLTNPICQQCPIGKVVHSLPQNKVIPLFIPTIHYIGEKIFEILHQQPEEDLLFIITACELTLEMFSDWGNMVKIKGIGIRLDGRICNTMKAFELSENGIKPGLTIVRDETQKRLLELIRFRRQFF